MSTPRPIKLVEAHGRSVVLAHDVYLTPRPAAKGKAAKAKRRYPEPFASDALDPRRDRVAEPIKISPRHGD